MVVGFATAVRDSSAFSPSRQFQAGERVYVKICDGRPPRENEHALQIAVVEQDLGDTLRVRALWFDPRPVLKESGGVLEIAKRDIWGYERA